MVIKFSEEQRLNAVKLYQKGNSVSEVEQLTGIVMKFKMSHEEFIQHCRKIAKRFVDAN